jgi:hypothetical protein
LKGCEVGRGGRGAERRMREAGGGWDSRLYTVGWALRVARRLRAAVDFEVGSGSPARQPPLVPSAASDGAEPSNGSGAFVRAPSSPGSLSLLLFIPGGRSGDRPRRADLPGSLLVAR